MFLGKYLKVLAQEYYSCVINKISMKVKLNKKKIKLVFWLCFLWGAWFVKSDIDDIQISGCQNRW